MVESESESEEFEVERVVSKKEKKVYHYIATYTYIATCIHHACMYVPRCALGLNHFTDCMNTH